MAIVDLVPYGSDVVVDTPRGFSVTPGQEEIDGGSEGASVIGPAFRLGNDIGSYFSYGVTDNRFVPMDENFNSWDSIKGTKYEPYWKDFAPLPNATAVDQLKREFDRQTEDRRNLAAAPWWQSVPAQMAAAVFDLPTLLPGGAFIRGARGAYSGLRSGAAVGGAAAASSAIQEGGLHSTQPTRTLEESGYNIGASFFLGGFLGVTGSRLLNTVEWNGAVRTLGRDLARPIEPGGVPGSAGAAAVEPGGVPGSAGAAANLPMDIEGNTIAGKVAGWVAAATAKLNPALELLQSPSAVTRETGIGLSEISLYLRKHMRGIASPGPAAETLMKEWRAGLGKAIDATYEAFPDYRRAGGQLSLKGFREDVGRANRRSDTSDDPHVTRVAQEWRSSVFEPLKEAAIAAKLLPEDVTVETAASYFSRMWNRNMLVAREGRFKAIVSDWLAGQAPKWAEAFDKETIARASKLKGAKLKEWEISRRIERDARFGSPKDTIRDTVNEIYDTLTGKAGQEGVRPEFITIKARGPLKERSFNIPDELVEDFLESDVEIVGRRYTRIMGADVELANKFGSVDMADQIQKIRNDYKRLRAGVSDEATLTKLDKREERDITLIKALRDLLRGIGIESPVERNYARISRAANRINYIRSMGEVVLASLTDVARPAMVHGLGRFMQTVPQLVTNLKGIKLSVNEAKLGGNVLERVLRHRLATLSEIVDPYASRGPVEAFLENMTNIASKWNGILIFTDMMKSFAAVMTQNRILSGALDYGAIKANEKAYLAFLNIDQSMAERITKQFGAHGETIDRVKVANTEKWTDPVAVRTYRAAMNKDVDSIIVERGVADVHLFAHTPTGRMLLQFKTFALASHQRVLLRGLQEDQTRFISGMIAMTTMGMAITYLKAISLNRRQSSFFDNPGWGIAEGLDRSGVFSVLMELANTFERATGINPIKGPLKALDKTSELSQKNQGRNEVGALLGPTAGLAQDVMIAGTIPKKVAEGEEVTQGQKNALERMTPFNSYPGVRQMIRYLLNVPD